MALSFPSSINTRYVPGGQVVDVSTASISYVPVPCRGVVVGGYATISAAITVANSIVTMKVIKSAVTTTIGTITITQSGSAAGSTFEASMSGSEVARSVAPGDTITFDSDGGATTTSIANFVAVIKT